MHRTKLFSVLLFGTLLSFVVVNSIFADKSLGPTDENAKNDTALQTGPHSEMGATRGSGNRRNYCEDNISNQYSDFVKDLEALPPLPDTKINWRKFYKEMQVFDIKNQMSCTGHSVARSLRLLNLKKGVDFTPSPEFLYDVGSSYFGLLDSGELNFPLNPLSLVGKKEADERLTMIKEKYFQIRDYIEANGPKYPASATMLILDYARKNPIRVATTTASLRTQ